MNIVVVDGSAGAPQVSRSFRLAQDAALQARHRGAEVSVHRVIDLDLRRLACRDPSDVHLQHVGCEIERAQALILISPIYQASFSGLLKLMLDLLPSGALAGKAVLMLSTAGSPAHSFVLGYALTPVVLSLGAQTLVPSWCALAPDWDTAAHPCVRLSAQGGRRLGQRVDVLLDHLAVGTTPHPWDGARDEPAVVGERPRPPADADGRRDRAVSGSR